MLRKRILNISRYRNERGANLVEYGLVIACVTIVALPAVWTMGDNTGRMLCEVSTMNPDKIPDVVWDQEAEKPCKYVIDVESSNDDGEDDGSGDDTNDGGSGYKPPPPPGWGS